MDRPVFDNSFVREMRADPVRENQRRQVNQALYSWVDPTPVAAPRLLGFSTDLAQRLGLSPQELGEQRFAEVFAGNALLDGMQSWAGNYGGHQFGHWAGQLGDGRAISLGELCTQSGERWELQLKGAGPTPYSRGADGRAVLRSSLREFVCSEAMHHLGVPTTRALSLVATGEEVVRDMFYDGHPAPEPGAVVCRAAPSFIRFGHFELPASRGEFDLLRELLCFTVGRDFPGHHVDDDEGIRAWFSEVARRTAVLIAHWMRVGFVHGVMNTDNMSILGLSIDYGPYGWIDDFDPDFTPNTTDAQGRRYRFGNQPDIGWWNLSRLAAALAPLLKDQAVLQAGLDAYIDTFQDAQAGMLRAKLGLVDAGPDDVELARSLFALMQRAGADMTLLFRHLADVDPRRPSLAALQPAFYDAQQAASVQGEFEEWLEAYARRSLRDGQQDEGGGLRRERMNAANPRYVFRNYLAQQAIEALEQGDPVPLHEIMAVLRCPYDEQPGYAHLAERRPEWARHRAGCSMLSCSS